MELIIVGAGGLGREVFSWLSHTINTEGQYTIKGFLDDNLDALDELSYPVKVIGTIADYQPNANEKLIMAILNPKIKKKITPLMIEKGAKFFTLVHPTAVIGMNVHLGTGVVICPNCILTNDIVVGDFVFLNTNVTLGHDTRIGNYTSVNGNVDITGNSEVGEGCFFGVGAKVIPRRKIEDWVTVGAGSVVIRNIRSGRTVFGNPAKNI